MRGFLDFVAVSVWLTLLACTEDPPVSLGQRSEPNPPATDDPTEQTPPPAPRGVLGPLGPGDSTPPIITLDATSPDSPSNSNSVTLHGTVEPYASVTIYLDDACGELAAEVDSSPSDAYSVDVTVPDNTTTTFYAVATDAAQNRSPCDDARLSYVEDSEAPTVEFTETVPPSPSNSTEPTVTGSAEPDSTVRVYDDASCTNLAASPVVSGDGSFEFTVAVQSESLSEFNAVATDEAGNASGCGEARIAFEHKRLPTVFVTGAYGVDSCQGKPFVSRLTIGSLEPLVVHRKESLLLPLDDDSRHFFPTAPRRVGAGVVFSEWRASPICAPFAPAGFWTESSFAPAEPNFGQTLLSSSYHGPAMLAVRDDTLFAAATSDENTPAVWENSTGSFTSTPLSNTLSRPYGSPSRIAVDSANVAVATHFWDSTHFRAAYWANGIAHDLAAAEQASGVFDVALQDQVLYMSGYLGDSDSETTATVFVDEELDGAPVPHTVDSTHGSVALSAVQLGNQLHVIGLKGSNLGAYWADDGENIVERNIPLAQAACVSQPQHLGFQTAVFEGRFYFVGSYQQEIALESEDSDYCTGLGDSRVVERVSLWVSDGTSITEIPVGEHRDRDARSNGLSVVYEN